MDNSLDIPGYKFFVDRRTGSRPDVLVAFLSISAAPGDRVNGRLIEVSPDDLAGLDQRERNYARVDVTARLAGAGVGTVWAYVGRPEARERFAGGLRTGRVVIGDEYYESVRRAFADSGRDGLAEFERVTDPPPCPIVGLRRVAL